MEATLTYYHLDSWTTITDAEGNVEQEASFDAWGNIRSAADWTSPMAEKLLFDRGFTGHEHLYFYGTMPGSNPSTDLSLINMNGRMYDPIMSSFLSVDNYVQSPENSQNFNRYAYCLNNPLKYTDPSGEFWHLVIGAAVGGTINLFTNWIGGNVQNFGQGAAYFGIGALAGGLSAGVGAGISSVLGAGTFSAGFWGTEAAASVTTSFASGAVIGAGSGFTGSFITCTGNAWMQGESFMEGLGTGTLGGLVGMGSGALLGGIFGGIDAWRHGRKFWSGDYIETFPSKGTRYPYGENYTQSDGHQNCGAEVAHMIDNSHGGKLTTAEIREEFDKWWYGYKTNSAYTPIDNDYAFYSHFAETHGYCFDEPIMNFNASPEQYETIVNKFIQGYDVPISMNSIDHARLLSEVSIRYHVQWFTGNIQKTYCNFWAMDPDTGFMSKFIFEKGANFFFLKIKP